MHTKPTEHDIIIAGGGISGAALGYGLAGKGRKVTLLDAPTATNKASRTNVGLIWCQSKFLHLPDYAKWGFLSSRLYPALTKELEELSGEHIPVSYTGGLIPVLDEADYQKRGGYIADLRNALGEYRGNMIDRAELEKKLPKITFGSDVVGAAWCEDDGVIDPLALLRAYHVALARVGVRFLRDTLIYDVKPIPGGYRVFTSKGPMDCERLVLAAGLANRRFVQFAMPTLPVYPDKAQVLLVERLPMVMPIPVLGVTQTFGGTIIIGFRHEKAGHDLNVVPSAVATEGQWALRVWPELGKRRLIRAWSGLRVM
ncbi:MAG: FAD-dependent oxidoreductase, partial [Bilophila sp.]